MTEAPSKSPPTAFLSYAHRDDAAYGGQISRIRERLAAIVGATIGRDFEIFQDRDCIAWGQHWPNRLGEALDQSLFLIPVITPSYLNSPACLDELSRFMELERSAGRNDLILPIYFLTSPAFDSPSGEFALALSRRQWRDWRDVRNTPMSSSKVRRKLDELAAELSIAINRGSSGLDHSFRERAKSALPEVASMGTPPPDTGPGTSKPTLATEALAIPPALERRLAERIYPMLKSDRWLGRYVQTLAAAASVSEELMLTFCKSRGDIGLFKDGDRWVAALSERLDNRDEAGSVASSPDINCKGTGLEFEIPQNCTFRSASIALAQADKCAVTFNGFDNRELDTLLTPRKLSTDTTATALERIGDIASSPMPPYKVTKGQGVYRLSAVKGVQR
jgi:TIR domain